MDRFKYFLMNLIFSPVYNDGDILVCYASQTGTGANLAEQSGQLIREQGKTVSVRSLATLQPKDLERFQQVLMIVSTCGEGEIPDDGIEFYEMLKDYPALDTPVSLLALGDRSYQHFCTAGCFYQEELVRLGASTEELPVMADGNPMESWQYWLNEQLDVQVDESAISKTEQELTLELVASQALHQQAEEGNQAYRLSFRIIADETFHYQAGDLLGIIPPEDNRERLYSIASGPSWQDNYIELCVGVLSYEKAGKTVYGQCSRYLTADLKPGERIQATWKSGGGLTLPESNEPLVMVATGAGIAPMMCLLQERLKQQHSGDNWLLFGNRKSSADYYYQDDLNEMVGNGHIQHLETAFSRETDKKVYVQNVLGENRERLADWLLNKNARLYACGRKELKDNLLEITRQSLISELDNADQADELLSKMTQEKRVCFELF